MTRSVVAIAIGSLLSDACYEMVIPLLPAVVTGLGGGAFALGLMEGLADAFAAPAKVWGGLLADRTQHRRAWAMLGYLGVGVLMPAIGFVTSLPAAVGLRVAAWMARGFRSPIKDTLLVDDTDPRAVNRAFGFQRALDTVGAVIGPAAAIALTSAHVKPQTAMLFAVVPGAVAGLMYLFVRERPRTVPPREAPHIALAALPPDFRRYLLAAGVFGAGNFAATMLVLVAIRAFAPLVGQTGAITIGAALYLGHNVLYAACTYPAGVLAERFGSGRMLLGAFALFAAAAAVVAVGSTIPAAVVAAFVLAAVGVAVLEPIEATFATELLPAQRRGTGFGALAAINGVGDLVSSAGVGLLWQVSGAPVAFGAAAIVCVTGLALLAPLALRHSARPSMNGSGSLW